ncbi:MAG TPA: S8 family serine peptidase [Pyrinomonadaceae bacterium]|nr:S8 family serine peptidase [Pyrinomonadaceae bacterium]
MANKRLLVKLLPSAALAANPSANLRPLYDSTPQSVAFGFGAAPAWFLADLPDEAATPWDLAHSQVANQLGVDESAVVFAEPDLEQSFQDTNEKNPGGGPMLALDQGCKAVPQEDKGGKKKGPDKFAWHLDDDFTQLRKAREAVPFNPPRTRIAHIDTGYDRGHDSKPQNILKNLERSFVDGDNNPNSANDPDRGSAFPDNSGHGTGTISILAGGHIANFNETLGGAAGADILPLRISNSVILFLTSAFAQALRYAIEQKVDVISISMGGAPSRAWNEAVNAAYEAGICIVAAAGNNINGAPTRHVVYPARYRRTIAACGVMANGSPYDDLGLGILRGNYGPDSSMKAALSTYTPNIPWAVFGCGSIIRQNGEGTSAATPQIAAAAALWIEKNKSSLPRDWRRVEAVRHALFTSAKTTSDAKRLGHGILQAHAALGVSPVLNLPKTPADSDSFAVLRVLTGFGIADPPPRQTMFEIELAQRWLYNQTLNQLVPDPDSGREVPKETLREFMDALIQDNEASIALRRHVASRYTLMFGGSAINIPETVFAKPPAACQPSIEPFNPPYRRIRTYAVDPSLSTRLATAGINEITLKVRWEKLEKGPKGEYIHVIDEDASGETYEPVDLDDPRLIATDGWHPSEGNAAFHQQMVYAVSMKTIEHFEHALGRPVLWRPEMNPADENDDSKFVRRLTITPHALRQANAFYSPLAVGLLFGYFEASATDPGDHVPGSKVYACLSHDIVAHETTHAILDGMHRRFNEPTNDDVLALHEAFADIIALMQHFTIPEILETEIGRTRGNLRTETILGSLALQFGRATGKRGALRDSIGRFNDAGEWVPLQPDPSDYQTVKEPHARGAILVAAVFDAFTAIYETRTADLLRIYTGGTGILPDGAIHPDLVHRLATEASKSAGHILNMCIRALDYLPPVDVTFGEYLRAIITADADLVEDDRYNYRVAFVEAFRKRGIYPRDLDTLSVDTLRWKGVSIEKPPPQYKQILRQLKTYADACFYITDRERLFHVTRKQRELLHDRLKEIFKESPDFATTLGLNFSLDPTASFEVHALRRSNRVGPDGNHRPQVVVALTQSRKIEVEGSSQPMKFRGGSTLIVDLAKPAVEYAIIKNIGSPTRLERTTDFLKAAFQDPVQALLMAPDRKERFAALHSLAELG